MPGCHRHHVATVVLAIRALGPAAPEGGTAGRVGPAGQCERIRTDHRVVVVRRAASSGERAVGIELAGADREQLKQLAREVLVRLVAVVVDVVQVVTHHRRQRDGLQDVAVVAERASEQCVVVVAQAVGAVQVDAAHHQDLLERPGHALAQLVGLCHGVAVEIPQQGPGRVVVAPAVLALVGREVAVFGLADVLVHRAGAAARVAGAVERQLGGDPVGRAAGADVRHQGLGRAEAGLVGEPDRITCGGRHRRWHGHCEGTFGAIDRSGGRLGGRGGGRVAAAAGCEQRQHAAQNGQQPAAGHRSPVQRRCRDGVFHGDPSVWLGAATAAPQQSIGRRIPRVEREMGRIVGPVRCRRSRRPTGAEEVHQA